MRRRLNRVFTCVCIANLSYLVGEVLSALCFAVRGENHYGAFGVEFLEGANGRARWESDEFAEEARC
jgi:hypothetical protein